MTSVREGWGLAVTEAARNATPAIAYNVPGLRDSVVDGRTGRIVPSSPLALARATHALLLDRGLCDRMSLAAWSHSQTMDWDATADAFEGALERVIPG